MGTLVPPEIHSRGAMINHLLQPGTNDGYEILDHSATGHVLYVVFRHPENYRFIGVYKLIGPSNRDRAEGRTEWGYNTMSEDMGPSFFDCPERILSQSDIDDESGWREECRRVRRRRRVLKRWASSLAPGSKLKRICDYEPDPVTRRMEPVYEPVVFIRNFSATYFVGRREAETRQYRMRWEDLFVPNECGSTETEATEAKAGVETRSAPVSQSNLEFT